MKLIAFLKRDLLVRASYRFRLLLSLGSTIVNLLIFYFVGRTFSGALSPYLAQYGNDYFPYVLIGIAVTSFVTVGLDTLAGEIRAAQVQGTLESLLCTPTSIYTILLGNSLSTFLTAFVSGAFLMYGGSLFVGLRLSIADVASSLIVLLLTFAAFLSVGMLSASFIMIFKAGNPIGLLFGTSSYFLGGVFFPVDVLPKPFRFLAEFLPITHAVKALRELLLAGAAIADVFPLVLNLIAFIVVLGPLSLFAFSRAVHKAKLQGSLVQF